MLKLGNILIDTGLLTDEQVKTALELQKMTHKKLGDTIIGMGMLTDIQIMKALEKQCSIPFVDLTEISPDPNALSLINEESARKFCALAIGFDNERLIVVINDPLDVILVDEIRFLTKRVISARLGTKRQIMDAIDVHYGKDSLKKASHKTVKQHVEVKFVEVPDLVPNAVETEVSEPVRAPVVVRAPEPPPAPVVVKAPEPAPAPVVVKAPEPPPAPVVVKAPEPPLAPVVVKASEPPPEKVIHIPTPASIPITEEKAIASSTEERFESMGGHMLDFTKSDKQYLSINMIDNQVIRVRMPTKKVFAALLELQDRLANLVNLSVENIMQLDHIYNLVSVILANNLDQRMITSSYLTDLLDIEDVRILADAYMNFVNSVLNKKN